MTVALTSFFRPHQVTLGFAVLLLSMGAGLMWFMTFMDETVMRFAGPF